MRRIIKKCPGCNRKRKMEELGYFKEIVHVNRFMETIEVKKNQFPDFTRYKCCDCLTVFDSHPMWHRIVKLPSTEELIDGVRK